PHHTNEIAQSESYLGHPWCSHWFHVHHLNTAGGKMSKSKGEFLTVSVLEEKGYDPLAYRFFCLQSHYRKALTFSWENLDNAAAAYDKLIRRVAALKGEGAVDEGAMKPYRDQFQAALDNDLNTSLAVTALYDVLKADLSDGEKLALIGDFDQVLGLKLLDHAAALKEKEAASAQGGEDAAAIEALIAQRAAAKAAKNWAEADRIRDDLKAQGIELIDTKEGTTWKRV
ncbi:MAG: cysteine--tRNA ligase, partial [Clostridiales bacterium]|nr:cysteine--tRNA ligase [Clostridiales bacterium]